MHAVDPRVNSPPPRRSRVRRAGCAGVAPRRSDDPDRVHARRAAPVRFPPDDPRPAPPPDRRRSWRRCPAPGRQRRPGCAARRGGTSRPSEAEGGARGGAPRDGGWGRVPPPASGRSSPARGRSPCATPPPLPMPYPAEIPTPYAARPVPPFEPLLAPDGPRGARAPSTITSSSRSSASTSTPRRSPRPGGCGASSTILPTACGAVLLSREDRARGARGARAQRAMDGVASQARGGPSPSPAHTSRYVVARLRGRANEVLRRRLPRQPPPRHRLRGALPGDRRRARASIRGWWRAAPSRSTRRRSSPATTTPRASRSRALRTAPSPGGCAMRSRSRRRASHRPLRRRRRGGRVVRGEGLAVAGGRDRPGRTPGPRRGEGGPSASHRRPGRAGIDERASRGLRLPLPRQPPPRHRLRRALPRHRRWRLGALARGRSLRASPQRGRGHPLPQPPIRLKPSCQRVNN